MKVKLLALFLLCFGLWYAPFSLAAQENFLEIDLKKDKRNLIMYFDLKEKGMLYITNDPGQLYHLIFVNPVNKIVWEGNIAKKELLSKGKVQVQYTEDYIYFIQLASVSDHGISILQFDEKGKKQKYENVTENFSGISNTFISNDKLYAVQYKEVSKEKPVYNFISFNPESLTPEKPVRINLPELKRGVWSYLGFDEQPYFYGIADNYNKDGSISAYILPASVSGRVSDQFIMNIKPGEGMFAVPSWMSGGYYLDSYTHLELDPDNHCIYAFGFMRDEMMGAGMMIRHHGFYIQKYGYDGKLVSEKRQSFKELQQTYPEVKNISKGDRRISLLINPFTNSLEMVSDNITSMTSEDIFVYKFDKTFKLKKVKHITGPKPSFEVLKLGLSGADYLISAILGHPSLKESDQDPVINKVTELTTQAKSLRNTVYNIKYYEESGLVMEYQAKDKILKLHTVKL